MTRVAGKSWDSTEKHILKTSAAVFARLGYHGASTREIASAAEISEVTIYRHYPRKRELFLAALGAELKEVHLSGELLTRLAEASSGETALQRTFELISSTLQRQPELLRLLHYSALEFGDDLASLLRTHLGAFVEAVAYYLKPWITRGELRAADAKSLVLTVIATAITRVALGRIFLSNSIDPALLCSDFCLAGYGPEEGK